MNAPWWTDGMREVLLLSEERVPLDELDYFSWEPSLQKRKTER